MVEFYFRVKRKIKGYGVGEGLKPPKYTICSEWISDF